MNCFVSRVWSKDLNFSSHVSQCISPTAFLPPHREETWLHGCWTRNVGSPGLRCFAASRWNAVLTGLEEKSRHMLPPPLTSPSLRYGYGYGSEDYCSLHFSYPLLVFYGVTNKKICISNKNLSTVRIGTSPWRELMMETFWDDSSGHGTTRPGLGCREWALNVAPALEEKVEASGVVWGWTVSPKDMYVEVVTLSASECDCI